MEPLGPVGSSRSNRGAVSRSARCVVARIAAIASLGVRMTMRLPVLGPGFWDYLGRRLRLRAARENKSGTVPGRPRPALGTPMAHRTPIAGHSLPQWTRALFVCLGRRRLDRPVPDCGVFALLVDAEHMCVRQQTNSLTRDRSSLTVRQFDFGRIVAVVFGAEFMSLLNRARLAGPADRGADGVPHVEDARCFDDRSMSHAPKVGYLQYVCNGIEVPFVYVL